MPPKNLNNTYVLPPARHLIPITICGIIMALSAAPTPSILIPSSPEYATSSISPTTAKAARWIQSGLFYFLFGAHAVKTVIFTKRLGEHGVEALSGAWWKWVGTCFVGGESCFIHFDQVVGKRK